jgi:hypothetical protein
MPKVDDFIDPHGPLSADMFDDSPSEFIRRIAAYMSQAKAATSSMAQDATNAFLEPALRAHVLYLAYQRLVTILESRPAQQSQPEYSRNYTNDQLRGLRAERDRYKGEFDTLLVRGQASPAKYNSNNLIRV